MVTKAILSHIQDNTEDYEGGYEHYVVIAENAKRNATARISHGRGHVYGDKDGARRLSHNQDIHRRVRPMTSEHSPLWNHYSSESTKKGRIR